MSQTFDDWDETASNNTSIGSPSVNIAELCAPGNVNNGLREIMAACVRSWGGMHSGTSRPAEVRANRFWLDTTSATAPVLKWYDGSDDIEFLAFDHSANTITLASGIAGSGLSDVVDDTSPQLGGDLDVNGNTITSASNGDVVLDPDGTGEIQLGAAVVTVEQDIRHSGDANNKVAFGTDTQDFQTGGSSRLDLSDSGVRLGGANARVTTVLDEDNMSSDSATALATQQSIKKYVDDNAGGDFTWISQSTGGGGTSIDVTGIGSGAKEVVVVPDQVNVDADDFFLVQLGDSGGVETSGYVGQSFSNSGVSTSGSGFAVRRAAGNVTGLMTLHNPTGNLWIQGHGTSHGSGGGSKTLSGTLDRIRLQRASSGNFQGGTVYVGYR